MRRTCGRLRSGVPDSDSSADEPDSPWHLRRAAWAHNPLRMAEDIATVDLVSNGRFDFAVGGGGEQAE